MDIVGKLWNFCNKLRHDGVDSSDYIEQLTYLLFLKMADEKGILVPNDFNWQSLLTKNNGNLVKHLELTLNKLKNEKGILGQIFAEPVSRVKNGDVLKALIKEIDEIQWTSFDADIVGLAFEELIGRVANEGKKGAGQYFTPRPLIQTIVNVIKPNPFEAGKTNFKISDVACGTAGFLVVASEWIKKNCKEELKNKGNTKKFHSNFFYGQELVQRPRRLALMNMFLHGIDASENIILGDSIDGEQSIEKFDIIITNPPFGNKGANPTNRDFPIKTSDKQLNFIQHIIEKLNDGGRAAIVLPDSCLLGDKAKDIWKYHLEKKKDINLHTILKLPNGTFAAYANGIKACVIFLQKGQPTKNLWIYDARTNSTNITKKSRPLTADFFEDFEKAYTNDPNAQGKRIESDRFKKFTLKQIKENGFNMDFKWLKDSILDSDLENLKDPNEIVEHIFELFDGIKKDLEPAIDLLKKKRPNGLTHWENHKLIDLLISLESGSRPKGGVGKLRDGIPSIGGEHLDNFGSFDFSNLKYVSNSFANFMTKGSIEKNDILIVKDGATAGKISYVDNDFPFQNAVINEHIFICRVSKLLSPKYVFWYLWSEEGQKRIKENIAGIIGGITKSFANEIIIHLPPIREQNQIAIELNIIFKTIFLIQKKISRIPSVLEQYKKLVLEQAVSGKLTEDLREKTNEDVTLNELKTNLNLTIPYAWDFVSLKKLLVQLDYGSSKKSKDSGKVAVLRMGNIQDGRINWDSLKYTSNNEEINKYILKKNDVLFNRTNSPELVGKTAIYKGEQPAIFAGYLIRVTCNETLNPDYLNICLNSFYAKEYCETVKVDSNSQSNINAQKLADFLVPYTSPYEQKEIVSRVEKLLLCLDDCKKKCDEISIFVSKLQHTVLKMAVSGELSEPQPGDEPVSSVILQSIQSERNLEIERKTMKAKNKSTNYIKSNEYEKIKLKIKEFALNDSVKEFSIDDINKLHEKIQESIHGDFDFDEFGKIFKELVQIPLLNEDEPFFIPVKKNGRLHYKIN